MPNRDRFWNKKWFVILVGVSGGLLSLTVIGALIGLPMMIFAAWQWKRLGFYAEFKEQQAAREADATE